VYRNKACTIIFLRLYRLLIYFVQTVSKIYITKKCNFSSPIVFVQIVPSVTEQNMSYSHQHWKQELKMLTLQVQLQHFHIHSFITGADMSILNILLQGMLKVTAHL
jgi:hypothetical protein